MESKEFFLAIGAKIDESYSQNKLELSDIDWNLIENWIKEGPEINSKSIVKTNIGQIPNNLANGFLRTSNETVNLMPRRD